MGSIEFVIPPTKQIITQEVVFAPGREHDFSNDHPDNDAAQIAEFLFLFKGIYTAAVQVVDESGVEDLASLIERREELLERLRNHIFELDDEGINELFVRDLGPERLRLEALTHESPVRTTFKGVLSALVLALALMGQEPQTDPEGTIPSAPRPYSAPEMVVIIEALRRVYEDAEEQEDKNVRKKDPHFKTGKRRKGKTRRK
jgi:hypothetical protein